VSASSKVVVERIYERWNRHEGDIALNLFHPEVEIHQMGRLFDSEGTFHGHEGLIRSGMELAEVWEQITWRPDEWVELDEALVVALTASGVGVRSRIEASTKIAHLWRVDGGLVKEFSVYDDKASAMQAAER
jgi:ketosteroid isomerase-like protein